MASILELIETITMLVPLYNGDSTKLNSAIAALKVCKTLITPGNNEVAMQIILSRLEGKASLAVGNLPTDVDEIIKKLETKCKLTTSPETVLAKLNATKQSGETAKFIEQIEILTLELEQAYINEKIPTPVAEKMAIKAGVKALAIGIRNPETRLLLKAGNFNTLTEAIQKVLENDDNNEDTQIVAVCRQTNLHPFKRNLGQPMPNQSQFQHSQGFQNLKYGNQRSFVSRYETHQKSTAAQMNTKDRSTPNASVFLTQQDAERNQQAEWEAKFKCKWNEEQIRWQRNLERLRRLKEDEIRLAEEQRRIKAINETRRREEEESKRSEEEARQKFDEKQEAERKEQEERDRQIREMIEQLLKDENNEKDTSINDLLEQNENQDPEDHRSFKKSYDNEDSATNQLRRKSIRGKTVQAVRERPIISTTSNRKKKNSSLIVTWPLVASSSVSGMASHSDELVKAYLEAEPSVIATIVKEDNAEIIECISGQQEGLKEATSALTTVYEIEKKDDPIQEVEADDQRAEQMEKMDADPFLLCLTNFKPPRKQRQQQPSPRSQQPSELHKTGENERCKDDYLDNVALRPSDGRWVPPAA